MERERPSDSDPDIRRTDVLETAANQPEEIQAAGQSEEKRSGSKRRKLLKSSVAGVVSALGFTGTAAAIEPTEATLNRLQTEYAGEKAAKEAVAEHGEELLTFLAERGYIAAPTPAAFVSEGFDSLAFVVDGTETAHVRIEKETADGHLVAAVEPQAGRQYATLDTGQSGELTVFDPVQPGNLLGCYKSSNCLDDGTDECGSYYNQLCRSYTVACCSDSCYISSQGSCCDTGTCPYGCGGVC